jgi:apolipoprotein N-acyltransferase
MADTLGYPLHASRNMRQAADLFGAHGLTFALVLGNECALASLRAVVRGRRTAARARDALAPASCLAALVASLVAYGSLRLARLSEHRHENPLTAAIVQGNLAHYDRMREALGTFDAVGQILGTYFDLSAEALRRRRPDMLIWPETVYPTTFGAPKTPEGADFDESITRFVAGGGVPLLFGAYAAEGAREFNAAVLLQPAPAGAMRIDSYRKSRLFPFTESLPSLLDSEHVRRLVPWAGTWTPGGGPRVLAVDVAGRPTRFAPLICYDALDPDFVVGAVRQDAELLVALSNDSWFAYPGVQHLIMILSAFRSIETRRPQLRSTPTGVSAVIDETGDVIERVGEDRRGIMLATVTPVRGARTLMLAWGNWLPPTALVAALALLAVRRRPGSASGGG